MHSLQDGALLTNGYSTTSSPVANSVQPLSAHSGHSDPYQALLSVPDTPDWRPYRQFVGMGQQNYLNHIPGTEHLLDANVPQVSINPPPDSPANFPLVPPTFSVTVPLSGPGLLLVHTPTFS